MQKAKSDAKLVVGLTSTYTSRKGELLNPLDFWFHYKIAFLHYFSQFDTKPRKMTDRVETYVGAGATIHEQDAFEIMITGSQVEVDAVEIALIYLI